MLLLDNNMSLEIFFRKNIHDIGIVTVVGAFVGAVPAWVINSIYWV